MGQWTVLRSVVHKYNLTLYRHAATESYLKSASMSNVTEDGGIDNLETRHVPIIYLFKRK